MCVCVCVCVCVRACVRACVRVCVSVCFNTPPFFFCFFFFLRGPGMPLWFVCSLTLGLQRISTGPNIYRVFLARLSETCNSIMNRWTVHFGGQKGQNCTKEQIYFAAELSPESCYVRAVLGGLWACVACHQFWI